MPPENSTDSQRELDDIRFRYAKRRKISSWKNAYYRRAQAEREQYYKQILNRRFASFREIRMLEIGAGSGTNLKFFYNLGIPWHHIHANELLEARVSNLREQFPPELTVLPGDALEVTGESYDIILASTVFSSILDTGVRRQLAAHLMDLLSSRGCILWYDLVYNKPWSHDVRGIPADEVRSLFPHTSTTRFWKVTLTPPVAMLVGPLYGLFSPVPFLRSHLIAEICR